jgi:hypothetical protein
MKKILLFHFNSLGEKIPIYFDVERFIKRKKCEFEVRPKEEFSAKFHPETITYTGVTVGGVHTGGFTRNEAHYSATSKKTGYADLYYREDSEFHSVLGVTFSKELKEIALREIGHLFVDPEKKGFWLYRGSGKGFSESAYMSAMKSGNLIAQAGILNSDLSNYATIETCNQVGSFLLRAIYGEFLTPEQKCEAAEILLAQNESTAWVAAADLLRNPKTLQERELAQRVREKIEGVKIYKVGNLVYKDKENYTKGLVNYILKKAMAPVLIICAILALLACMPGRDTSGYFIALMIIGGIWFVAYGISEANFKPDKNSYYERK